MEEQLEEEMKTHDKSLAIKKIKELIRKNFLNSEIEVQLKYLGA